MPVVAVVNRKGGSGKSTLATHLAGYCSNNSIPVMLGDVDRQQSTQTWLRLREARHLTQRAAIMGWTVDPKNVLRVPPGTPGGMHGFELARVVMFADAILMPVCNSVFDRESAAECYAELMTLPRVVSGRCKVAAVGMRLDARTKSAEVLKQWAERLQLPFVGVLRDTQAYVKCIEQGLTLFDTPGPQVEADMAQWQPILQWLQPVLHPVPQRVNEGPVRSGGAARPSGPMPLGRPTEPGALRPLLPRDGEGGVAAPQRPLVQRPIPLRPVPQPRAAGVSRESGVSRASPTAVQGALTPPTAQISIAARIGRLLGTLPIPGFLQRHS
jgi:chromosome partitioning protein